MPENLIIASKLQELDGSVEEVTPPPDMRAIYTKRFEIHSENTLVLTIDPNCTYREPLLVLVGAQSNIPESAAIFTPTGNTFTSLGGNISMEKSGNDWTITFNEHNWAYTLLIGTRMMLAYINKKED